MIDHSISISSHSFFSIATGERQHYNQQLPASTLFVPICIDEKSGNLRSSGGFSSDWDFGWSIPTNMRTNLLRPIVPHSIVVVAAMDGQIEEKKQAKDQRHLCKS